MPRKKKYMAPNVFTAAGLPARCQILAGRPGLVMVFDKIGRPSILLHRKLAFKNPAPQIRYGPGNLPEPFAARSEINIGIPEIEHHGKIAVFPNKRLELVIWHARRFRYGHAIIPRKSLPTQLPEKFPESPADCGRL